jgi:hypothetical protein
MNYPMVSLENAILFDAESLLFLGMPGDLAFSREYLFKELPYPSVSPMFHGDYSSEP